MRDFQQPGRSGAMSTHAMVATSHGLATSAALKALMAGGNAIDAAITAAAVLAVVEPTQTGIGGDCFALFKRKGEPVRALNGAGWSPEAASSQYLTQLGLNSIDSHSPHAVTVPGAVAAWARLSNDHGRLPLSQLLQPAIDAARSGYPVTERLAFDWNRNSAKQEHCEHFARIFYPAGRPLAEGERHRQPMLANTLEAIAEQGPDVFYKGWVAADIIAALRKRGGLHTASDFADFQPEYVEPICVSYRGYELWECPPSGQGVIALAMLKTLERFDLKSLDPLGPERFHLQAEASRIAYAERDLFLCDTRFGTVPVEHLLSDRRADQLADRIKPASRIRDLPTLAHPCHSDTVYISVVDSEGMAVSFINSIFDDFGSALVAPESGVLLHNRGASFVIDQGHPNCIAARKRPMHTIIPAMLTKEGEAVLSLGVTGGHFQPLGQVQVLTNILDYGMSLQEAIDFPRMLARDDVFELETTVPQSTFEQLVQWGHDVKRAATPLGASQAVLIDRENGVLHGAADFRRDGVALGY